MGNELTISVKIDSNGQATIQQVAGGLGGLRQEAGSTGQALTRLGADAEGAGATLKRALELAGITIGIGYAASKVREFVGEVMTLGARTEMLRGSAYAVGRYYQVSGQAVDYYVSKLKEAGITEQNAYYGVSKFLSGGLNLEQIEALAQAARNLAPLAPEAKSLNEEFQGLVTTISSGAPRGLREFGVQMGNILGDAGRSIREISDEMSMTSVERAQATMTYVLNFAEQVKYVGQETADAYARQQSKLKIEAARTKQNFFEIFRPIGEAVTGEKIKAWEDLNGIISRNKTELIASAEAVGVYVGRLTHAAGSVLVFLGTHKELLRTGLELATAFKVTSWILAYINGTTAAAVAAKTLAAAQATAAATSALTATAQTAAGGAAATAAPQVLYLANAYGAVTGTATVAAPAITGAGTAAATSGRLAASAIAGWTGLAGAIKTVVIGLAVYGAYQTFRKPGQLTGPQSSGDPFADVIAGDRSVEAGEIAGRGPLTVPDNMQQFNEFVAREEANKAVKLADDLAKKNQPPLSGKGGGGAGAGLEAAERGLENFLSRMQQETARGAGEGRAMLDAWYGKEAKNLDQLAAKGVEVSKGKEALDTAYYAKADKLAEEYNLFIAKESGDTYAEIEAQAQQWLTKYQGFAQAEENIAALKARKIIEEDVRRHTERLGLEKSLYDALAQSSPILSQQLEAKGKALELDIESNRWTQEKKLHELQLAGIISAAQADEARGLQALADAGRRYALGREKWMTQGFGGGAQAWAANRLTEMETRSAQATIDAFRGAESYLGQTGGQAIVDYLHGKKADIGQIFGDALDSAIKWAWNLGVQKFFDQAPGLLGMSRESLGLGKPDGSDARPFTVRLWGGSTAAANLLGAKGLARMPGTPGGGLSDNAYADLLPPDLVGQISASVEGIDSSIYGLGDSLIAFTGEAEYVASAAPGWAGSIINALTSVFSMAGGGGGGGGLLGGIIGLGGMLLAPFTGGTSLFASGSFAAGTSISLASTMLGAVPFAEGGIATRPTLALAGEAGEEAFIPLRRGAVPVRFTNRSGGAQDSAPAEAAAPPFVYSPTYHFSAIDAQGMDQILAEHLPRHEAAIRRMLKTIHRKGGRVEDLF